MCFIGQVGRVSINRSYKGVEGPVWNPINRHRQWGHTAYPMCSVRGYALEETYHEATVARRAICCVAFAIRPRSRTRVHSLRPHPQCLASHSSCNILIMKPPPQSYDPSRGVGQLALDRTQCVYSFRNRGHGVSTFSGLLSTISFLHQPHICLVYTSRCV